MLNNQSDHTELAVEWAVKQAGGRKCAIALGRATGLVLAREWQCGTEEKGSHCGYPSLITRRGRRGDGYSLPRLRTFATTPAKPVPKRIIVAGSGTGTGTGAGTGAGAIVIVSLPRFRE